MACALAALARPGVSRAAENFELHWWEYSYGSRGSCNSGGIVHEGIPFFHVNAVPIPTFTLQGYPLQLANHDIRSEFTAPFNGSILRVGSNGFTFDFVLVGDGGSACDISDHQVALKSGRGLNRPLFNIQIAGTEFHGVTSTSLSLREIDSQLADDVERWKRNLNDELNNLQTASTDQADYLRKLGRLEALDSDIDDLFKDGFGEVTPEELDQLLDAYADILSPDAQAALVDLLSSFRRNIEELRAELDRINSELANQTQDLNNKIEGVAGQAGFDPSDPNNYTPQGNPAGIPTVGMPPQIGTDPFDPDHDPYAAMAASVTADVQSTLDGQGVRDRARFLQLFASWRRNITDIETSFLDRAWISQREYTAFLNARNQVLSLFRTYVDDDGWLKDTPIPPGIKPLIDLLIVLHKEQVATALKIALNEWRGALTERQQLILDAIRGMRAAIESRKAALARQQDEQEGFWSSLLDSAVVVVRAAVLAVTPVGDFVDLCEIITGREGCMPDGRELTVKERMLSGAGLIAGSGYTWRAVAGIVRKSEKVTKKLSDIYDELRILTPREDIIKTERLANGGHRYTHANGLSAEYDADGFPDFREYLKKDLEPGQLASVDIVMSGSRRTDARLANAEAGFAKTPVDWVWHHDKQLGRMHLVPKSIHDTFSHSGGVALWQKIMEREYDP